MSWQAKAFGESVAFARNVRQLSLREAAPQIGVTVNVLHRAEHGENGVSIVRVARIAKWANLSLDNFVFDRPEDDD